MENSVLSGSFFIRLSGTKKFIRHGYFDFYFFKKDSEHIPVLKLIRLWVPPQYIWPLSAIEMMH